MFDRRNDTDREVSSNTTAKLKEGDWMFFGGFHVPIIEVSEVFETAFHDFWIEDDAFVFTIFAVIGVTGKNIAHGGIFKAGDDNRNVFLVSGVSPAIVRISLFVGFDQVFGK